MLLPVSIQKSHFSIAFYTSKNGFPAQKEAELCIMRIYMGKSANTPYRAFTMYLVQCQQLEIIEKFSLSLPQVVHHLAGEGCSR